MQAASSAMAATLVIGSAFTTMMMMMAASNGGVKSGGYPSTHTHASFASSMKVSEEGNRSLPPRSSRQLYTAKKCSSECFSATGTWYDKCADDSNACAACFPCRLDDAGKAIATCEYWCGESDPEDWDIKCDWTSRVCSGCPQCPIGTAFPPWPPAQPPQAPLPTPPPLPPRLPNASYCIYTKYGETQVAVTYRDFLKSRADFQRGTARSVVTTGMVESKLVQGVPVCNKANSPWDGQLESCASLNTWYTDDTHRYDGYLTLQRQDNTNIWSFDDQNYFPLDGAGYKDTEWGGSGAKCAQSSLDLLPCPALLLHAMLPSAAAMLPSAAAAARDPKPPIVRRWRTQLLLHVKGRDELSV